MSDSIPAGFCQCGCGRPTSIEKNRGARVPVGAPRLYARGHGQKTSGRPSKKRERYALVSQRNHPRAHANNGVVLEHILVVERALGHALPPGACVHHVNHIRKDNRPENLVVCQDAAYHSLLHRRERAYLACGDANAIPCDTCHVYAKPQELILSRRVSRGGSPRGRHHACHRAVMARLREHRRAQQRAT